MPETSKSILDALLTWRDPSKFVHVHEAAQDAQQQGRKIDALVIGAWRSTGHQREAVEVKISWSDLKRELDNPTKSDWWWAHCHRFWLATTEEVVKNHEHDVPATWGIVIVSDGKVRQKRAAPLREKPDPLPWSAVVGLVRNAGGAGANALLSAYNKGFTEASERHRRNAERTGQSADSWQVQQWKAAFDREREVRALVAGENGISLEDLLRLREQLGRYGHLPSLDAVLKALQSQAKIVSEAVEKMQSAVETLNGRES